MDFLRVEGEVNFLQFLPPGVRSPMIAEWYIGDRAIEAHDFDAVLTDRETRVAFRTDDPKREFVERVIDDHLLKAAGIRFDEINYLRGDTLLPEMPKQFETHRDYLNGMRALTAPGTSLIRHFSESDANLAFVRVRDFEGEDHFATIVVNRWHDNVNSMFGEESRLDAAKDTMEIHERSIGSYPNIFFDVEGRELPEFFDLLQNFDGSPEYVRKFQRFAVFRTDPRFWSTYDWFQHRFEEDEPLQSGIYDLNRYSSEIDPLATEAQGFSHLDTH
jgi:hypothetical protein